MKKQIFKYIAMVMVAAITSSGCKKALDLKPLDRVSDVSFWTNASDYKLAANNLYSSLRTFSQGNGDGHSGTDLGADRGVFARGTNTASSYDANYASAYKSIRDVNTLLAKAKSYPNPSEIKTYVAEAKFFRAYIYFDKLFTSYGGVVILKEPLTPQSPELKAPRNTRDETLDFII